MIIHQIMTYELISNRLDVPFSFGIWHENEAPKIEIYPGTDASSMKWGKLTPTDFLLINENNIVEWIKHRDESLIKDYQHARLEDLVFKFKLEIDDTHPDKHIYTDINKLTALLKEKDNWLFNFAKVEKYIAETRSEIQNIGLGYLRYAKQHHLDLSNTVVHGHLLSDKRIIIADISTPQRWKYLKHSF